MARARPDAIVAATADGADRSSADARAPSGDAARSPDGTAAAAGAGIEAPERPRLAPGVRPAGRMEDSAFADPPWLLEREGEGYVQVTELLYRIAERCAGRRTLRQIAAEVTDATGRSVSADNVRQLVTQQLLMKGLVQTADGRTLRAPRGARSPLALSMRVKMTGSGVFAPAVELLRLLYWPPVLVLALIAIAAFHGWLYGVHGIAGGLRDALYRPGLLLVVLAATVVIAWFHELGHAAALRYGGGRVRAMGFGLYLVYPAFYTDVSDNYRLPRWARVRTDLGGFYFNLLAALALGGLYALTGAEFLLLLVTLINLDIVRQMLPFVRLDGYWVLADLTGIPDFFSQMGRFLRRLLPFRTASGERLPRLRSWGTAVFLAYLLVTVPVLVLLVALTVTGLPRLLATAWDSFGTLRGSAGDAWRHGDRLRVAATAVQIVALALPVLGITYSLARIGGRLGGAAWRWSARSASRRALVVTGAATLVAALAYLWTPRLPRVDHGAAAAGPAGNWRPIAPEERGTVADGVRALPVLYTASPPAPRGVASPDPPAPTPDPSPNPSPSPTPTPVASPGSASTAAPSSSPGVAAAGMSPQPSAAPATRASPEPVILRTAVAAALRAGPGASFAVTGALRAGERVRATARSADGAWYRIEAGGGGWLAAGQTRVEAGAPASLPLAASPAPTAIPSPTPTAAFPSPAPRPAGTADEHDRALTAAAVARPR